ncbi:MAG: outer membrane beta-barrel protein [Coxiellaceae bacterium]|nr:outer membrane beta-barrel protein [Coxiellaceae bacterium]
MRTLFKSLLAIFVISFSVIVLAGGPVPAPAPEPEVDAGVYVDLSVGYAAVNWAGFGQGAFDAYNPVVVGNVTHNRRGGVTAGFDVGYQINRYVAVEGGWYYLPSVHGNSDIVPGLTDLKLKTWLAYLGLKFMVRMSDSFDFFIKAGGAYRKQNFTGTAISVAGFGDASVNYVSGIVGAGLQWWLDDNWSLSAQYLYMLGRTNGTEVSRRAPGANLMVASVGYMFGVE